jgi:hypothetical protein
MRRDLLKLSHKIKSTAQDLESLRYDYYVDKCKDLNNKNIRSKDVFYEAIDITNEMSIVEKEEKQIQHILNHDGRLELPEGQERKERLENKKEELRERYRNLLNEQFEKMRGSNIEFEFTLDKIPILQKEEKDTIKRNNIVV